MRGLVDGNLQNARRFVGGERRPSAQVIEEEDGIDILA